MLVQYQTLQLAAKSLSYILEIEYWWLLVICVLKKEGRTVGVTNPLRCSCKLQFSGAGLEKAFYTGWLDQWGCSLDEVREPTNQRPCSLSLQWPDFSGRWKDRLRPRLRHQSSGLKLRIVAMTGEGLSLDKKYNIWQKVPESIPPSPHAWKMLPPIHKFAVQDNAYFLAPLAMVGAKPGRTLYRPIIWKNVWKSRLCFEVNRDQHSVHCSQTRNQDDGLMMQASFPTWDTFTKSGFKNPRCGSCISQFSYLGNTPASQLLVKSNSRVDFASSKEYTSEWPIMLEGRGQFILHIQVVTFTWCSPKSVSLHSKSHRKSSKCQNLL